MENKIYNGSAICVLTSQLFLIAGIYNIYYKNIVFGILLICVYLSSTIYHCKGNEIARRIDLFVIFIMIIASFYYSYYYKDRFPLLVMTLISIIYVSSDNYLLRKLKKKSNIKTNKNEYHLYDNIYHGILHIIAFITSLALIKK